MSQHNRVRFCITGDGTRIAYATHGHGPPLVKVSHWLTNLEDDWRSPLYRPWIDQLSARHTLICYDARGTGLSDRDADAVGMAGWVADLEAVVDDLNLPSFALLAMVQGGPVAIEYAVRHPERVSKLLLYGTFARGRLGRGDPSQARATLEATAQLMSTEWDAPNSAIRHMWSMRVIPDGTLDQLRWLTGAQRRAATAEAAIQSMRAGSTLDVTARAAEVACPALIMHAREDALVPFESGRHLASLMPSSTFVPLSSRNHFLLPNESAWRPFVREVETFLGSVVDRQSPLGRLTPRELELLGLISSGLDNAQIGGDLAISAKTVRNHITHIFQKLGTTSRAQAIVIGRDAGLQR